MVFRYISGATRNSWFKDKANYSDFCSSNPQIGLLLERFFAFNISCLYAKRRFYIHTKSKEVNPTPGKKPEKKRFGRDAPPKGYPKDQSAYADPENWRYPLHTPWHAKAARRYFDEESNRSKYTEGEQAYMDSRIDQALERFGSKSPAPRGKRPALKKPPADKAESLSLERMLRLFLGAARFERAKEIDDSQVSIFDSGGDHIAGKVKDYVVDIDVNQRVILHDCEDWRNNMDSKNMCKHLGRFLLSLGEEKATSLLGQVLGNLDQWTFVAPDK